MNPTILKKLFSKQYKSKVYDTTNLLYNKLKVHADGDYPGSLINDRRPSESEAVKKYRESIYEPITVGVFGRIFNSLNKIRRSAEWSIKFTPANENKLIAEGEGLSDYLNSIDVTKWCFDVLLKALLVDPNGYVAVMPNELTKDERDFVKPELFLFYSNQVIEYKKNEYLVVKSSDTVSFIIPNTQTTQIGSVYYVFTPSSVTRYEEGVNESYNVALDIQHNLGYIPATQIKGLVHKTMDNTVIYKSRINPIVPKLEEAIREYSDLQAEVVQHIYSEKWEYASDDCNVCKGQGVLPIVGTNSSTSCGTCNGTGGKTRGPYTSLVIKAPMAGEANLPTPPIGYVQKNTAIVEIQDKRIDAHIYKALSAINMQFLDTSPIAQSGIAKEVDRDELNNFVHNIAEDLVGVLDNVIKIICDYRYSSIITDKKALKALLPVIPVPERFDILSSNYLEMQLLNAKQAKFNPIVVTEMEIEYANKKYVADAGVRDLVVLAITLDPLAGISEEDKTIRLANRGISQVDYIVSSNINQFVKRAIAEDKSFASAKLENQKAKLAEYAAAIVQLSQPAPSE